MVKRRATLLTISAAIILIIAAGLLNVPVGAQTDANSAQAEPGVVRTDTFEMLVRAGFGRLEVNNWAANWTPFRVALSNQGPPISGRLIVRAESAPGPNPQKREFIKDVQLPTGSRQLHEIPVFLSTGQVNPEVVLVSGGSEIAKTELRVERSFGRSNQIEVGVVDNDPTTLNNISSIMVVRPFNRQPFTAGLALSGPQAQKAGGQSATPQPSQQPVQGQGPQQNLPTIRGQGPQQNQPTAHPVVFPAEDLPRDFVSYDPLDVVVIGDGPLNQLTDEQSRAMKTWVASGGVLIVTGAADIAGLKASGLDLLLPVEVEGSATSASIPELAEVYGPFDTDDPALLLSARARPDARTLIGGVDRSIVAERNYGSGLVRFVALNPKINPYRAWGAAKDLWADLLLPATETKPRNINWITVGWRKIQGSNNYSSSDEWGIQNFLFRLAEIEPPSQKYFFFFLLFYLLAVGPVNYVALRRMRKLDLAWLTIPAVVILFTIVSVAVAQISRGGSSVAADVSLVHLFQQEGISRVSGALLIMPTSKGTYDITLDGPNSFASDTAGNASSGVSTSDPIESVREPKGYKLNAPLNTWTSGIFKIRSILEDQSPVVSIRKSAGATVAIKNLWDVPVTKAVYLSDAGMSDVFDLAPGEEARVALTSPQASTFADWYSKQLAQESQEASIFVELASVLDREIKGEHLLPQGFFESALMSSATKALKRPLLIGFIDKNPAPISFQRSLKRRTKAFYVVHL